MDATKQFFLIKAVRQVREEMEGVGLEDLKALTETGQSIIQVYLDTLSSQKRASVKRDLNVLLQLGITPDMLLTELTRQMPELLPIMKGKEAYKKQEIARLSAFIEE